MPVLSYTPVWYAAPSGTTPSAPANVTSITKDAGATLSFLAPSSAGTSSITSYTATPYIAGVAQTPTTTAVGSAGSITGSNGNTYVTIPCTGLTNSTAYTFSVHASSAVGAGTESAASGANTPLAGLVFGDDFNGPASGPIDPEWWVYNRCGYIAQAEVEWYLPSQTVLDGSSNLLLKATKTPHSGVSYPSDGNTVRNQTWLSGACQSNTRTYNPTSGNTMTFEGKYQICPDIAGGMWPGMFWLVGGLRLNDWKTDPLQNGWDATTQAEIDIAEWNPSQTSSPDNYANVTWNSSSPDLFNVNTATNFSAAQHVYQVQWKPGVSCVYFRDGTQTHASVAGNVPAAGANFFLLLYLQIIAGSATADNTITIDYIRVFDLP
jgi:hypothetical protein